MRGMNPIVLVFVIIGALVVLGFVLKVAFTLIGLALLIGAGVILYYVVLGAKGNGR